MFTFDFSGGLKLDVGASYLHTGNFYKQSFFSPEPDDLWMLFGRLQLEF